MSSVTRALGVCPLSAGMSGVGRDAPQRGAGEGVRVVDLQHHFHAKPDKP